MVVGLHLQVGSAGALLARLRQQACAQPARQALAARGRRGEHVVQADQVGFDRELPAGQHLAIGRAQQHALIGHRAVLQALGMRLSPRLCRTLELTYDVSVRF